MIVTALARLETATVPVQHLLPPIPTFPAVAQDHAARHLLEIETPFASVREARGTIDTEVDTEKEAESGHVLLHAAPTLLGATTTGIVRGLR
jgi:hypothetical protein